MADTKALEELNREIVKLVDELSAMQAKQERLKELMRRRSELEQQLLGVSSEPVSRVGRPRRTERVEESAAVAA
ncbi:MAG TPA: hypothetical protein VOB72_00095, partial [Candidatus Dormibacteraeota bacterium]|nr:hypothetical protein [Candidatus Dormibacteraeota bacterium]